MLTAPLKTDHPPALRWRCRTVWALLVVAACGGGAGTAERLAASTPPPTTASAPPPTAPAPPPIDPAAPPALRLWTEPDGQGVVLHIESRGQEPAHLRTTLAVEKRAEGGWEPIGTTLPLRIDCDTELGECLTLAPGGELLVPAWAGAHGELRCGCGPCPTERAAEVRFVVQSCAPEGHVPHRVASSPLSL